MAVPGILSHLAANSMQWLGNANQALGDAQGAARNRQVSSAIRDPNLVLSNPGAIFNVNQSAFTPAQRIAGVSSNGTAPASNTDPNQQQQSGTYTGDTATSGPTAADLAQYDQAISQYQNQLGNLDNQLGIAHGNIDRQFGVKQNELQSGYNAANQQYGQNTSQNSQQYLANKNQVRDTASAGLRGLLRTLGAYGAGGTDATNARNIVAQDAAKQAAGAGETFGQNQQALDSSWGTYGNQFEDQKKQLNDWRTGQIQQADQQGLSTKQSVLQTLAQLRNQRAGGNSAEAQAALAQANALQPQIDQLGAINPTYTGVTPTYKAPDVASYTVNPNAQVDVAQNANDSMTSPWLAALLGKDKKQQPVTA